MIDMKEIHCNTKLKYKYYVTKDGNVYSDVSKKWLKPWRAGRGYLQVQLVNSLNKGQNFLLHRLVLMMYQPNPYMNELQVNHIDGNKQNNSLENLEWVTATENMKHAIETNLLKPPRGITHGMSKLTEEDIKAIILLLLEEKTTQKEIAKQFNVLENTISRIKSKKRWEHLVKDINFTVSKNKRKLTKNDVTEIIYLLLEGILSHPQIAAKFKVTSQTINSIKNKDTWKHLTKDVDFTSKIINYKIV